MSYKRKKVSIIGAGYTGATTAFLIASKELADVVVLDIPKLEKPTMGKALDMLESGPVLNFDVNIKGTTNYEDISESDLVIITAGVARKPGMSRDDLVHINKNIMSEVAQQIKEFAPNCIILVLSNPVDVMTYYVYKASGFSKNRVIGQSGVLDSARFCTFIASELNVSVKDVSGLVLGSHGDDMVPLTRFSYVGGIPLENWLSKEKIDEIILRTRKGGGEIVNLLGNGSAYYAPASALTEMAEAILKNQRRILPAIAYLDGEYGYNNIFFGVPTILGANGIEKIIELDLIKEEKVAIEKSVNSVKKMLK